ncbi:VRR-NUC domain protein [Xylanimonas cellulosilytica DSM 15894]|uniref:VRR-NUC domain protein n=1 Tax=Xylanimonas cellulosilytica (strain DSM 15894 / JCM 12276 / CECT 5975 / KCTC 9989 / LMG 20990 / NBRC 107835 / XIL07) TaxID=446471 RepID=D1BWL9_XYLCX|nr:VRR-NUC domain-containing protein [Xylanimonas cellulosilytica]ACZ29601.1 VRR-NUC domain protein [Xylanimonas cellulosilytica DSM 15894]
MNRDQYVAAVAKDMTERALQSQVEALMRETGWMFFHPADNRPNARGRVQSITAGYPDLHGVRRDREIYIELKRQNGRVSDAQKTWLHALEALGHEVHVFRPDDLLSGRILAALTGRITTETKD